MATLRKCYFITGTDTDVGKTLVSCALLIAAANAGFSAVGIKPLAAGATLTPEGLRNSDAVALQAASTLALPYEQINPVCLQEAAAPHIAAASAGRKLHAGRLAGFCQGAMALRANLTLIEGAGGWRVPLNEHEFVSDLAKQLQVPVILVVNMRLGCLNHALLTAEAIVRDGLVLAGWVANSCAPPMSRHAENLESLRFALEAPLLAEIPYIAAPASAAQAAQYFALDQLLHD